MAQKKSPPPTRYTAPPLGLLVSELQVGYLYRCRLSFQAVLVLEDETWGPHPDDPRTMAKQVVRYGWRYNPVYGRHERCELKDRMLVLFA